MHRTHRLAASTLLLALACGLSRGQEIDWEHFDPKKATPEEWRRVTEFMERAEARLAKTGGVPREIRSLIIAGNKITTVVYNYGNITRPNTLGNTADLVWNRLGHGFEFTPLVAGEVITAKGDTVKLLDDGMWLANQGGYAPDGSIKWGWLPKAGYAAPEPNLDIAHWSDRGDVGGDLTRRPPSWPESWYNPAVGRYVWPAFLGNDASTPDEEVYFVCDDWTNAAKRSQYLPFPGDSTRFGLGLDLECRFFQFNNPLAEDIIFLVYRVTNRSPNSVRRVYFGMYGDPHIGGPNDFADDLASFIPPRGETAEEYPQRARSMVYAWDEDGKGDGGLTCGYFGFKFLESPTNSFNTLDDDDDGIIDESPFNGTGTFIDGVVIPLTTGIADTTKYIKLYGRLKPRWSGDENGDWNPDKDDVGLDGLPGTGDFGEGNGKPDIGYDKDNNLTAEPRFGIRDVNESDQIGLTSFWALGYTNSLPNVPKNDVLFWQLLSSDSIAIDQVLFDTPSDNIFLYGSGPFALAQNETQRFSIALLMGLDKPDLLLNSETAQRILEANYLFAQPPPKPNVKVVTGDGRVTLYWDNNAEGTFDPLTGAADFEGYKVYRSEDPTFADIFTITDANGVPFLGKAMLGKDGSPAQFDLVNEWSGLHPVEYLGRGVKYNLGTNTGLVHEYVDSTVTNGKTYYYAVASYDHGFYIDTVDIKLPPTESQIVILRDPITQELKFDQNTVKAVPGPLPLGQQGASVSNNFSAAPGPGVISTGDVRVSVLDNYLVPEKVTYDVHFRTAGTQLVYDVQPATKVSETFVSRDTLFANLTRKNLVLASVIVKDAGGATVNPSRYVVDGPGGRIKGSAVGSLPGGQSFTIEFEYSAVYQSTRLQNQDDNPVFDGMKIRVADDVLGLDSTATGSGWVGKPGTNLVGHVGRPVAYSTANFIVAPIDLRFAWNKTDTTANGKWLYPGDTLLNTNGRPVVVCPFKIVNLTDTSKIRAVVVGARDSVWKPGREIAILTPTKFLPQPPPSGQSYMGSTFFDAPAGEALRLPTQGDAYLFKTTKPFVAGDFFTFTTQATRFDGASAKDQLERICVVPNPYVATSALELPGVDATRRGDRKLQFRNLPPACTIRIYTMVGELVATIQKNDNTSIADWDILSYEGQRLAYGVYIYHVDVPDVGSKIGRLALIK